MNGWYAYDYRAGTDTNPAVNVFRPAIEIDGASWVNHRQWSIDDPESPPSVLALVRYESWRPTPGGVEAVRSEGEDLRGGCVSFDLNTDDLDVQGGYVDFWVMSGTQGQRWHTLESLPVGDGWTSHRIDIGATDWRQSWSRAGGHSLEATLATASSYGVAFVGFDEEPVGVLGIRDFRLDC